MRRSLPWALFLAVSWTWCIGMYLPTLMVRDGGLPFFFAFLIPNVLGAASVGWVLRDPERSRRFVATRRTMMLAFTAVTIAFHAYFLVWQSGSALLSSRPERLGGVVLGISLIGNAIAVRRRVDWLPALVTLLISVCFAGVLVAFAPTNAGASDAVAIAGLAAVTSLGFLLCPYLDLTFNRAAQHAKSPRAAFTIGFLVIFTATILLATGGRALWTPRDGLYFITLGWYDLAVGCHFGAQAMFTVAAHIAALRLLRADGAIAHESGPDQRPPRPAVWATAPILVGLLAGLALFFLPGDANERSISLAGFTSPIAGHEVGYRLFLGAYGLVFPVWLLMTSRGHADTARSTLAWTAVACVAGTPFLWVGAVGRDEVWLLPGVALLLVLAAVRYALAGSRSVRFPGPD